MATTDHTVQYDCAFVRHHRAHIISLLPDRLHNVAGEVIDALADLGLFERARAAELIISKLSGVAMDSREKRDLINGDDIKGTVVNYRTKPPCGSRKTSVKVGSNTITGLRNKERDIINLAYDPKLDRFDYWLARRSDLTGVNSVWEIPYSYEHGGPSAKTKYANCRYMTVEDLAKAVNK